MRTSTKKHVSVTIVFGRRLIARLALALLGGGCGTMNMQRVELRPQALDSKLVVDIWSQGKVLEWHSVIITGDSVTGIPREGGFGSLFDPNRRVGVPLAAVDSIKVHPPRDPSRIYPEDILWIGLLFSVLYLMSTHT